jgi:hypothetical protein
MEREETKQRCVTNSHIATNRVVERLIEKQYKTNFNQVWSIVAIKEVREKFHKNFQASYRAHPLGYRGVTWTFQHLHNQKLE